MPSLTATSEPTSSRLAAMLRIPVCMHNVDEEKIFRPSVWAAFGSDPEGSDFRACNNYGPVYR